MSGSATSNPIPPMGVMAKLPNELLFLIGDMMDLQTISRFSQSCRFLRGVFSKEMRKLAVQHAVPGPSTPIPKNDLSFCYWGDVQVYYEYWTKNDPHRPAERMHDQILLGNVESLKFLLEAGVSPDAESIYGGPMITAAAVSGKLESVKLLVKHGVKINPEFKPYSPLRFVSGDREMVMFLIESGCTVSFDNFKDICKMKTPIPIIQCMINQGTDLRSIRSRYNDTVLHAAAEADEAVLRFLLPQVPDIVDEMAGAYSALGMAFQHCNWLGALHLLKAGAEWKGVHKPVKPVEFFCAMGYVLGDDKSLKPSKMVRKGSFF